VALIEWKRTDLLGHLVASSAIKQANRNADQAPDRRRWIEKQGKTDPDQEINQHKADSTRNNFSIATQQVLQPDYRGHRPLPLLIGTKT
jgi:chromatin segregation and condensation protein Rec8/ScpA/Scc1 (kleisin family)